MFDPINPDSSGKSLNENILRLLESLHSLALSDDELSTFNKKYDLFTGGLRNERSTDTGS